MNQRILWRLSALAFLALVLSGPAISAVVHRVDPDADLLTDYLFSKGLFAVALLAVLSQWDGLRGYGFERARGWWFLLPAAPVFILTALVLVSPESTFGLGMSAALGWTLVAIFVGIGEEGVFRGLFWRALEDRGVLTTSLVTSLLFGTVHLVGVFTLPWQIAVSQAVFAAGTGMMFAAIRLASGSVLAPIFLHALFDAAALVAAGGAREMLTETFSVGRLVVPGLAFFVWGLLCVLVIRRRRRLAAEVPNVAHASTMISLSERSVGL